jgi:hypothetical protein
MQRSGHDENMIKKNHFSTHARNAGKMLNVQQAKKKRAHATK